MPPLPFPPLNGWLGFAVRPRESRTLPWSPDHPHATVALIEPTGWDEVSEGTAFFATGSGEPLRLVYSELSRIPYGCDDRPREMVAFTGPDEPAEGIYWVSPDPGASALPIAGAGPTWAIGGMVFEVETKGDFAGISRLREGDRVVWKADWEKGVMAGVDRTATDLANPFDHAVPRPVAAWGLPSGDAVIVVQTIGYEGVTWDVLHRSGKGLTSAGKQYVFVCSV